MICKVKGNGILLNEAVYLQIESDASNKKGLTANQQFGLEISKSIRKKYQMIPLPAIYYLKAYINLYTHHRVSWLDSSCRQLK